MKNREDAANILETIKTGKNQSIIFTPDKALGFVLLLKLSTWKYITLREQLIREGVRNVYLSYYKVQQAKTAYYPAQQCFTITETMAKVNLQSLLDCETYIKKIIKSNNTTTVFDCTKWGFDGPSSQNRCKNKI